MKTVRFFTVASVSFNLGALGEGAKFVFRFRAMIFPRGKYILKLFKAIFQGKLHHCNKVKSFKRKKYITIRKVGTQLFRKLVISVRSFPQTFAFCELRSLISHPVFYFVSKLEPSPTVIG